MIARALADINRRAVEPIDPKAPFTTCEDDYATRSGGGTITNPDRAEQEVHFSWSTIDLGPVEHDHEMEASNRVLIEMSGPFTPLNLKLALDAISEAWETDDVNPPAGWTPPETSATVAGVQFTTNNYKSDDVTMQLVHEFLGDWTRASALLGDDRRRAVTWSTIRLGLHALKHSDDCLHTILVLPHNGQVPASIASSIVSGAVSGAWSIDAEEAFTPSLVRVRAEHAMEVVHNLRNK